MIRLRDALAANQARLIALINTAFAVESLFDGTRIDEERLTAIVRRPLLFNDRAAGSRRFGRRRMQVAAGEFDECGPIGSRRVAAGVLAEGEAA